MKYSYKIGINQNKYLLAIFNQNGGLAVFRRLRITPYFQRKIRKEVLQFCGGHKVINWDDVKEVQLQEFTKAP